MVVSKEIDIGKDSKDVQDIMYVLFACHNADVMGEWLNPADC